MSIINYVSTTLDTMVFDESPTNGVFADDPYVTNVSPKSILCTPILHLSKLQGEASQSSYLAVQIVVDECLEANTGQHLRNFIFRKPVSLICLP